MLIELRIKASKYKNNNEYKLLNKQVKEYEDKLVDLKSRNNLNMIKGSFSDIALTEKMLSALRHRAHIKPIELGLLDWLKNEQNIYEIVDNMCISHVEFHIEYIIDKINTEFKTYDLINIGRQLKDGVAYTYVELQPVTLFGSNKFDNIYVEVIK